MSSWPEPLGNNLKNNVREFSLISYFLCTLFPGFLFFQLQRWSSPDQMRSLAKIRLHYMLCFCPVSFVSGVKGKPRAPTKNSVTNQSLEAKEKKAHQRWKTGSRRWWPHKRVFEPGYKPEKNAKPLKGNPLLLTILVAETKTKVDTKYLRGLRGGG